VNRAQHVYRYATILAAQGLILSHCCTPSRKKKNEQYPGAATYSPQGVVGSHLRHIVARRAIHWL
jgi:hypothetical protein